MSIEKEDVLIVAGAALVLGLVGFAAYKNGEPEDMSDSLPTTFVRHVPADMYSVHVAANADKIDDWPVFESSDLGEALREAKQVSYTAPLQQSYIIEDHAGTLVVTHAYKNGALVYRA